MTGDYVSHADLGGQPVHRPVTPEPEGQLWHADWEPRVLALTLAMGATGAWNLDMSRAARETLSDYDDLTYYEVWLAGLLALLEEHGLLDAEKKLPKKLVAEDVPQVLARGAPTVRPATTKPLFTVGQQVRTRPDPVPHHTRLPGYARGKVGQVERINGVHVFADAHASGQGEDPQWLYTVAFKASELWPDGDPGLEVSIDAWEPYLKSL
jgi:nitrile hydratase beta subunit